MIKTDFRLSPVADIVLGTADPVSGVNRSSWTGYSPYRFSGEQTSEVVVLNMKERMPSLSVDRQPTTSLGPLPFAGRSLHFQPNHPMTTLTTRLSAGIEMKSRL